MEHEGGLLEQDTLRTTNAGPSLITVQCIQILLKILMTRKEKGSY